jgi:diguanylate cyclase (GGDEF)-like protein
MRSAGVGCLVVTDRHRPLAGILSERDIAARVIGAGLDPNVVPVHKAMSSRVVAVSSRDPMAKAEELMSHYGIRHLPVLVGRRVAGIISSRDVIAHQVRTSKAKQQAAEEAAHISAALTNLDDKDVTDMILRKLPGIFSARRAVLYFRKLRRGHKAETSIRGAHCACPPQDLASRSDVRSALRNNQVRLGRAPAACRKCGVASRRLLIPVRAGESRKGRSGATSCLCLCDFDSVGLTDDILAYKASLAREILVNLSHARVFHDAQQLAMTDSLTGAGTRRMLDEAIKAECSRADRYGRPFSVAMIDIDHFKAVNDTNGHRFGDRVLAGISDCIRHVKRTTDILVRYGGDELVLLMPESNLSHGTTAMERMRRKVKELQFGGDTHVTISCGVAERPVGTGFTTAELLRRADMALYRAKRLGRDRVETWEGVTGGGVATTLSSAPVQSLANRLKVLSSRSKNVFLQSVGSLVAALEARDAYTRQHSENVLRYALAIARTMGLPESEQALIRSAAMVHDLGKIGIPDTVLLKPGRLTSAEMLVMRKHPLIAVRILEPMRLLDRELPIIRHHHERWDGNGYPDHLRGTSIPLGARVLAAADAFDAMTSRRVYQCTRTVAQAEMALRRCAGTQFDPAVSAAFCKWLREKQAAFRGKRALATSDLLESDARSAAA